MKTPALYSTKKAHRGRLMGITLLLFMFAVVSESSGRQVTMTITDLRGQMQVYGRSGSPGIGRKVKIGELLKVGDTIQTQDGAEVTLTLPEGSTLHIGENTGIDLVALALDPATGARQSQVKLLKGRMRATLSAGHQKEGSAFTIETPNAIADVKFSQPVIDVSYDPETDTTTIDAHTVDVIVTNLRTMRVQQIPRGNQGTLRRGSIVLSQIIRKTSSRDAAPPEDLPQEPGETDEAAEASPEQPVSVEPQEPVDTPETTEPAPVESPPSTPPDQLPITTESFVQTRTSIRQATSATVPSSVGTVGTGILTSASGDDGGTDGDGESGGTTETGGGAETSTNPSPGERPERPERQRRVIIIHLQNL